MDKPWLNEQKLILSPTHCVTFYFNFKPTFSFCKMRGLFTVDCKTSNCSVLH